MQQALNKVTVDKDGNPTAAPTELVKLDPLFDSNYTYDTVYNLSYAPDSKSVVASRNTQLDTKTYDDYRSTLEKVDTTTGEVTTLVGAYCDYFLRGGYGANGAVYFSRSDFQDANCSEYPESMNTNIWYIPAGSTEAQQLTFDTPDSDSNIDEYYIDASPDNKQLLIVDLAGNMCDYAGGVLWGAYGPLFGCTYYYLNLADGTLSDALDMNSSFVPKFFSPDNLSIIGTLYPQNLDMARSFDPTLPSTAAALRSDLANPVAVTNLVGVQEWAPKIVAVVPSVPTTTTAPTLPNTGANSVVVLAFAVALVALGGASLATSRRR
jgi:LPXTG-motif cell wall-anchored protein